MYATGNNLQQLLCLADLESGRNKHLKFVSFIREDITYEDAMPHAEKRW